MSYVYLLVSTSGNTYVGATVDLNRRLRQHNKEIKGGAVATGTRVAKGETKPGLMRYRFQSHHLFQDEHLVVLSIHCKGSLCL